MRAAAATAGNAVVVGAGLIGLKTALALAGRGLRVTVLERLQRVMPQQLDETGAAIIAAGLQAAGVAVVTGAVMESVEADHGRICGVRLSGGGRLACDLLVVAAGTRANTALAREVGLAVETGIVTDRYLCTSQPDIYAAGDAAQVSRLGGGPAVLSATWPAAVEQGELAARNMAGERQAYRGYLAMNSAEIAGIPLVAAGDASGGDSDEIATARYTGGYRRLVRRGNALRGFLLIGDIRQAGVLAGAVARSLDWRETPAAGFVRLLDS